VEDAVAGTAMPPDQAMTADIHARFPDDKIADLRILWGNLPRKSRFFLAFSLGPDQKPVLERSEEWTRMGIQVSDKYAELFPPATADARGCPIHFDRKRVLVVSPGDRDSTTIPRIHLSHGAQVRIAINLITPKNAKGMYEFDLVRVAGKKILGGVAYRIRVNDKK
jgi:hypothetical protein